ncbi:15581_t:CDS:2, partial [Acaulospora morrowiae]
MGWEPGKGLGLNEDGTSENIQLSVKQDNLGIGASKTEDNWLENSFAFDELLKGLNQGKHENEDDLESEEKVKKSKSKDELKSNDDSVEFKKSDGIPSIRLAHRMKFLKSKKASVKDTVRLNEIFGIKTKSGSPDIINKTDEMTGQCNFSDIYGVQTTVNKQNVKEYFASKTKVTESKITTSEYELEERPVLGMDNFEFSQNENMTACTGLGFVPDSTKRKEKKKKRLITDNVNSDCVMRSEKKKRLITDN